MELDLLKILKMKLSKLNQLCVVALIIFTNLLLTPQAHSASKKNLQLQLGDSVSIYSEKAYRKNKGLSFEAVGNVVILSGKDTLYGEKASLDVKSGHVRVEGNVRFISQDITIYGSDIEFNSQTGQLDVKNARIITTDFNIVASEIKKMNKDMYYAKQAEFTTCKDCTESWTIYGSEIFIEINQYVKIKHALTKIKGVSVLYFPYIAIPIKNNRETGLLFPKITTRLKEGLTYQQPFFWAINDSKDMTFTPSFYGRRGYGTDVQYRQVFGEKRWVNLDTRLIDDSIYLPLKKNNDTSGTKYFRSFYDIESHYQFDNSLAMHFQGTLMKDIDLMSDFNKYTGKYVNGSDIGVEGYVEKRFDNFEVGLETGLKRNLLVENPESLDKEYVQVLPSIYLSSVPVSLLQSDKFLLQQISVGLDSDFTVFKQIERNEKTNLRNIRRVNLKPYLDWHLFTYGPVKAKTQYQLEYQNYDFIDKNEKDFHKYAGILTTEFSFSMDKVFGLAYEEVVPVTNIKRKYLEKLGKENKAKDKSKFNDLIGEIPSFENSLTQDSILFVKNSYRHSQEFKFLHHFIANSAEKGNAKFREQLNSNTGWLDYDDGIKEDVYNIGAFQTRTQIPLKNTIEFQWNNSLIRKSPKKFNFFDDDKYLRDNFNYNKIGYFNVSQGVVLDSEDAGSFEESLTRLYINTGYTASRWSISLQEYYFHQTADQMTNINFQKRYDAISLLSAYNYNSLPGANIKTLRGGFQIRPFDTLGFSILKEQDLHADANIRSIYQVDFMPDNNCWIFNLNYRETVVGTRYTVNWVFNFGNDDFKNYRKNFFTFNRLSL